MGLYKCTSIGSIQREIYSKISFHLGKLEKEEQSDASKGKKRNNKNYSRNQ